MFSKLKSGLVKNELLLYTVFKGMVVIKEEKIKEMGDFTRLIEEHKMFTICH